MKIIKLTPASQTEAATATINLTPAELVAVPESVWIECRSDMDEVRRVVEKRTP